MKTLILSVLFGLPSLSFAQATDVCATQAAVAVKNAFSEYFQRDSEGLRRYISYSACKSADGLKYCKVGTKTADIGQNIWFSVVLNNDCTKVVGLKMDSTRDE
ncbi:hypothetical protein D3C87_87460 [compost metagenome]